MSDHCFPLRRVYLLLLCWVSLFPSISSKHLSCYVSFIHMLIRLIMFTIFLVLYNAFVWRNISLKAVFECKSLFRWAYSLCYISSVLKGSVLKERTACSSFFDQELRFAIANYIYLVHLYMWFPFTYCKSISYKGKLLSIIT